MLKKIISFLKDLLSVPKYEKDGYTLKGTVIKYFNEAQLNIYIEMLKHSNVKEINFDYRDWKVKGKWQNYAKRLEFACWFFVELEKEEVKNKVCNEPESIQTKEQIADFVNNFINNYAWKM